MPMFEEAMGRSIGAPAPAAAATPTPKSPQTNTRRRSNPLKGTIILNNNNNINIEGPLFVKPSGLLLGWYWKERWVSLKGNSLTVHTRKTKVRDRVHVALTCIIYLAITILGIPSRKGHCSLNDNER